MITNPARPTRVIGTMLVAAISATLAPAARSQASAEPPAARAIADLRDALEPIRAKHGVPALGVAVFDSGGLLAQGAVGVRAIGSDRKVTVADRWHIGSCTKAFTATLAAVMVGQGTLKWSTTVGDVFGADVPDMHADWKAATLAQLVTNRAGAPADLDADGLWARLWERAGTPRDQRMQLVRGVLKRPPQFAPGSKFLYSNAGFAIAGAMMEKTADRPWEDLLRDKLLTPLGVTTGGFGAPGTPADRPEDVDQPRGHSRGKAVPPGPDADNPPAIGPAGTLHLSLADWARFGAFHASGRCWPDAPGLNLPEQSLTLLHTSAAPPGTNDDPYAMGWITAQRSWAAAPTPPGGPAAAHHPGEGPVLTHAGSNTMWFAVIWLAPGKGMGVVAAVNQAGRAAEKAVDEAALAAIQRFIQPAPRLNTAGAGAGPATSAPIAADPR